MPVRARSTTPAIKDKVAQIGFTLASLPTTLGTAATLFMDPWYDFEVKSITALMRIVSLPVVTTGSPFALGYGAYTNQRGVAVPANLTFFLAPANCLDSNNQLFSIQALAAGSLHILPVPADNGLGSTILPAGAPLVVSGSVATANTGQVWLTVLLRPKDWDRGDSSKRPWGASDDAFATYYK